MGIPQLTIIDVIRLHRKDFRFKTIGKACCVLTCRLEGESLFFYDGKECRVKRGDVLFLPFGSSYSQSCEKETVVCFHLSISGAIPSEISLYRPKDRERACELFRMAAECWKRKKENYELLCTSYLYEILSLTSLCSQASRDPDVLKPALDYLDAHLWDGELSLEAVCREGHVSRTHFNKLFRRRYGKTPTAHVNLLRVERAKQLLVSGSFSNEEIAALCGFRDVKYFYVVFKRLTGITTTEYKKEFEKQKNQSFVSVPSSESLSDTRFSEKENKFL